MLSCDRTPQAGVKIAGRAWKPGRQFERRHDHLTARGEILACLPAGGLAHAVVTERVANALNVLAHALPRRQRDRLAIEPKLPQVPPERRGIPTATERARDRRAQLPTHERRLPVPLALPLGSALAREPHRLKQPRVRDREQVIVRRSSEPAVHAQQLERAPYGVAVSGRPSAIACARRKKPARS